MMPRRSSRHRLSPHSPLGIRTTSAAATRRLLSSLHTRNVLAAGPKHVADMLQREFWLRMTAHEDIQRRKAMFGPSVNTDVRFAQHDDTGNAGLLAKMMEMRAQHVGTGLPCRLDQGVLQSLGVHQ